MEPWQQRVIDEKVELDARIERLEHALKMPLGLADVDLMKRQLGYMRAYSCTLRERIARFSPKVTVEELVQWC